MNDLKSEVATRIINYLAQELEIDAKIIDLNDSLEKYEDYGLNSIYFVRIVIELEKMFTINFEDDYLILENYKSVNDLVNYILKKLEDKNGF